MATTHSSESPPLVVTEVRILLCDDPKLKAFASITLNSSLRVRGLKLVQGNRGLFVVMPNRRRPDGTFVDVTFPLTLKTREYLEAKVIKAYFDALDSQGAGVGAPLGKGPDPLVARAARNLPERSGDPTSSSAAVDEDAS